MPKIIGVTWPKPRPFWGKLFMRPLGFPKTKLCTKFEVPSSSSFENMIGRMPIILGVTWPKPRPFGGKLFVRPLGFPKTKLCTKFEVSSWSSFEDIFDRMPKITPTFRENYLYARSVFPIQSCIPNLKSLAQVVFEILRSKRTGSRVWPFKVTWCHRSRDHSIAHVPFHIGSPLEPNLYL